MDGDALINAAQFEYVYGEHEIVLNTARRSLTVNGVPAALEPKPLAYLAQLMHAPRALQPFQLGLAPDEARNVTVCISRIRSALGKRHRDLVRNKRGQGYWFEGEVQRRLLDESIDTAHLKAGQQVAGLTLEGSALSARDGVEVWRARNATGRTVVAKFAIDAAGVKRLEREDSFWRLVDKLAPPDAGLFPPQATNFADEPQHLLFPDLGLSLPAWQESLEQPLSRERRTVLADQILRAASTLHHVGVIHGDIKPANLIVQQSSNTPRSPQVAIVDLGSARKTRDSLFLDNAVRAVGLTVGQQELARDGGTLQYVAPECLQGGASIAGDVYALGVVLYQLFAGDFHRPLTTSWQRDIDDPALRELLIRATERDPARRFRSVEAMRAALEQLAVRREEILALARERRSRERRPWLVALMLALASGVVFSSTFAWQARVARNAAEAEREISSQVTLFLTQFLRAADPRAEGREDRQPLIEALSRAAASLDLGEPDDLRTRMEINAALHDIYAGMSMVPEEIAAARRAVELAQAYHGAAGAATYGARYELAITLANHGRIEDAEAMIADADHRSLPDRQDLQRLDRLAALARGRISAAALDFVTAREHLAATVDAYRSTDVIDEHYATTMVVYAEALARSGDREQSLATLDELQRMRQSRDLRQPAWQRLREDGFRGQLLGFMGRQQEAIETLEPVLERNRRIYGDGSVRVGWALATLGQQHAALGLYVEAVEFYNGAASVYCENGVYMICAGTRGNLAFLQYLEGDAARAVANLEQAKESLRTLPVEQQGAMVLFNYYDANAHLDLGEVDEAVALFESLNVQTLDQAAPGAMWDVRVALLAQRIALYGPSDDPTRLLQLVDQIEGISEGERQRLTYYPGAREARVVP